MPDSRSAMEDPVGANLSAYLRRLGLRDTTAGW